MFCTSCVVLYFIYVFFLLSDNSFIEANDGCRLWPTLNTTYLVVSFEYLVVPCHIQRLLWTIYTRPPKTWFEESLPAFSFIAQHRHYYYSMENWFYFRIDITHSAIGQYVSLIPRMHELCFLFSFVGVWQGFFSLNVEGGNYMNLKDFCLTLGDLVTPYGLTHHDYHLFGYGWSPFRY